MVIEKGKIDTEIWFDSYSSQLHKYAFEKINDYNVAADMVQDTFLAGLNSLDRFEGKCSDKTWLFAILKRKVIDHWRMQGNRKTLPFTSYQKNGDLDDFSIEDLGKTDCANGEYEFEKKELREILFSAIQALPEKWVPIVMDRLVHEKGCEEISEKYDISVSNVWVIIFRAKADLRKMLETVWVEF